MSFASTNPVPLSQLDTALADKVRGRVPLTPSAWAALNPVLAVGEVAIDTAGQVKVGDGQTAYNSLGYMNQSVSPPPQPPLSDPAMQQAIAALAPLDASVPFSGVPKIPTALATGGSPLDTINRAWIENRLANLVPTADAPLVTTHPGLASTGGAGTVGTALTFTAGAASGTPAPTLTYALHHGQNSDVIIGSFVSFATLQSTYPSIQAGWTGNLVLRMNAANTVGVDASGVSTTIIQLSTTSALPVPVTTGISIPTGDGSAPEIPNMTLTVLDSTHYKAAVTSPTDAITSRRLLVWQQATSDTNNNPNTNGVFLGFIAAGVPEFQLDAINGQYARVSAESSNGFSTWFSTPLPLFIAPAPPPANILPWFDPRVQWWIRAGHTFQEIGNRWMWTGFLGQRGSPQYEIIQNVFPPVFHNIGGVETMVFGVSGGWFQHRTMNGMEMWADASTQRQRMQIHTTDESNGIASLKYGHGYWIAWGFKFYANVFTQTDANSEDHSMEVMDCHHSAPSSAMSGQTPIAMYIDGNGYLIRVLWNSSDCNFFSPTGDVDAWGQQRVVLLRDNSEDVTNPHFFVLRFQLDWNINAPIPPYVEMWRKIGLTGSVIRIGRWNIPNTWSGSNNTLFFKYGNHQWYATIPGRPAASLDSPGALIVEDLPGSTTIDENVMFASLLADIPGAAAPPPPPPPAPPPAPSAPTKLQTSGKQQFTATGPSLSFNMFGLTGIHLTAGTTVVIPLVHTSQAGRITSITAGGTNVTAAAGRRGSYNESFMSVELWVVPNIAATDDLIVINAPFVTEIAHFLNCSADEWTALAASAFDVTANNEQTPTTAPTVASGAHAIANSLIYSVVGTRLSSGVDPTNFSTATIDGTLGTAAFVEQNNASHQPGQATYRVVNSGTGSKTSSWTCASQDTGAITVVLKGT